MNVHAYFYHSYNLRYNSFSKPHLTERNLVKKKSMSTDHPIAFSTSADLKMLFSLLEHTAVQFLAMEGLKELLVWNILMSISRITCRMQTATEGGERKRSSISIFRMVK